MSVAEAIGELIQAAVNDKEERRTKRRFAYTVVQAFAPYDGQELPTEDMFRQVLCRDLCTGGLSFIWPSVPDFQQVVIRLTTAGNTIYIVSRVAYHKPVDKSKSRFVVGCEFLDRVQIAD